jgi:hypothetical protein
MVSKVPTYSPEISLGNIITTLALLVTLTVSLTTTGVLVGELQAEQALLKSEVREFRKYVDDTYVRKDVMIEVLAKLDLILRKQ